MLKRITVLLIILFSLFVVCSCKQEPDLTEEAEKIATVGLRSSIEIMNVYNETGSYTGVSTRISGSTICFSFSNASITLDFSDMDSSIGIQTVKVNGEVVFSYEALPATYPYSVTYNLSYTYAGKNHTLEIKGRFTGVSSSTVSLLKVDGKSYDPSILEN